MRGRGGGERGGEEGWGGDEKHRQQYAGKKLSIRAQSAFSVVLYVALRRSLVSELYTVVCS